MYTILLFIEDSNIVQMTSYLIDKYTRYDRKTVRFFDNGYIIIEDLIDDLYICIQSNYDHSTKYRRSEVNNIVTQLIDNSDTHMNPYRTHDELGMITIYENNILHYSSPDLDAITSIDYEWFIEELEYGLAQSYLDDLVARL